MDTILNFLPIFFASLFSSFLLIKGISFLFYKIWIIDNPKKYWYNRAPVPYSTWVIFFINLLILSPFFFEFSQKLLLILFFWFIITFMSFLDDMMDISPKIRLIIQIFIGFIIWLTSIKIWYVSNIFWWVINLETYFVDIFSFKLYIIPILFTIFWYVLIFNSLNWSDWIPWITSWISFISFFILASLWIILFNLDQSLLLKENALFIIKLCLILMWSLLVFWSFDVRTKVLMWDSWTMFLAFMLATLAIISWWKIATVCVVFWIYLIDAFYVISWRIYRWKSPLKKDFTHLHHRLLDLWLSKKTILSIIYFLSLFFWFLALFLQKEWKIWLFFIIAIVVIFMTKVISKFKN